MTAYYLLSRPVFDERYATEYMGKSTDPMKIMEDYSRNSAYLVNLSQAIGRVILAGRDLTRFAGYTSRISEFLGVLESVKEGNYVRSVQGEDGPKMTTVRKKDLKGRVEESSGEIVFDKTAIRTPNGDVLIPEMSFRVEKGMHTIITGPNGSGKSSLFRILGDLWPVFDGVVRKPKREEMFYVPQKPYLALGSLREQVIYPHSVQQARQRGFTDGKLREIMEEVELAYLIGREGGWDAVADWADVLRFVSSLPVDS